MGQYLTTEEQKEPSIWHHQPELDTYLKSRAHEAIYLYISHLQFISTVWCIPVISQAINALAFQKQQTMLVIMNLLLTFQNHLRRMNLNWIRTVGKKVNYKWVLRSLWYWIYTVMYLNIEKLSRLKIHNLHMTKTRVINLKRSQGFH